MANGKLTLLDAILSIWEDSEIGAASVRIPAALKKNVPDHRDTEEFINDFFVEGERFNKAVKTSKVNPETKNRHTANKGRVKTFLFFRDRTESYINSDIEEEAKAAALLMACINLHGYSLHLAGLDKLTVLLVGLILDLQSQEMLKAMETLGVKRQFDAMVKSNADYKLVDAARTEAGAIESPTLIEARKALCLVITECNNWLSRRYRKESQVFEPMVRHWNEIITELNAQAQSQETRKANEAAAEKKTAVTEPVAAIV